MFQIVLERILAGLGAGDKLITAMGPSLSILLAIAGGTAIAQYFKFLIARKVKDEQLFAFYVRTIAIAATFALAMFLTEAMRWPVALLFSFLQLAFYHITLAIIRRWLPWFEMKPFVGAVCPPVEAQIADAVRKADKAADGDDHRPGV